MSDQRAEHSKKIKELTRRREAAVAAGDETELAAIQKKQKELLEEWRQAALQGDPTTKFNRLDIIELFMNSDKELHQGIIDQLKKMDRFIPSKKYTYNIQNSSNNNVLEDLRNYKNFRSSVDEFYNKAYDTDGNVFGLGGLSMNGTGPSRSYYMSNGDFLFSNSIDINSDNISKPEVQSIILNEFQPDRMIYLNEILASAINVGNSIILRGKSIMSKAAEFFEKNLAANLGQNAGAALQNYQIQKYSLAPGSLYNKSVVTEANKNR